MTYAMIDVFRYPNAKDSRTMHHAFSDDIVSVTNLRKDLPAMLTRVRSGVPVTIMQGDQADLVIVKRADLAAMAGEAEALRARIADLSSEIETLEVLGDAELLTSVQAGIGAMRDGRVIALDDLGDEG